MRALPAELNRQNIDIQKKSKNFYEERKACEIKIGSKDFEKPDIIKSNAVASEKWDYVISIIADNSIDFVTDVDVTLLSRYCVIYADFIDLLKAKDDIKNNCGDVIASYKILDQTKILKHMYTCAGILTNIEDRLLLTPASRIKGAAKRANEKRNKEQAPLALLGFKNL